MNDFKECKRKRLIQEILFKIVGSGHIATVLLGPNPDVYLTMLRKYITSDQSPRIKHLIHGYEYKAIHTLTLDNDIRTYHKDIFHASATSFIDLDLCGTLLSGKYLMLHLFEKQQALQAKNKAFMVTFSMRGNKQDNNKLEEKPKVDDGSQKSRFVRQTIDTIGEMIQRRLEYRVKKYNSSTDYSFTEYLIIPVQDYEVRVFSYNDNGPMITCLIKY